MRKLATLMFVLAAASAADAKPKKGNVKVHMDKAAKAHKAGKFDVALTELQAAYSIEPQPKLLFAIAQVHAKLDNCEAAIEYYEKFAASTKDKSKQTVVQQAIDACKKKLDEAKDKSGGGVFRAKKPTPDELPTAEDKPEAKPEAEPKVDTAPTPKPEEVKPEPKPEITAFDDPPPPPPPAAKPAPEPVAVTTTTTVSTRSPWYRDPLGDALVITGVGATIASVLVLRSAQNDLELADGSNILAEYEQHRNDADRKELYTWILAGGGLALVSAGVLRYAIRDNGGESRGVAVVPTRDGGLVTWSGGF